MCGRFALSATPEEVAELFELDELDPFPPRYNIAPTQPILMIAPGASGRLTAPLVRWGFVPSWVKDPADFTLLLNARSETAAEKPSFRNAMRHRRTLIPASGFYEWHRPADKTQPKQAYWIKPRRSDGVICFGGLMETWASANGSEIDSGCILTTRASHEFSAIHHRLPVVIKPEDFDRWLDCRNYEPRDMVDLMQPVEDGFFDIIPISDKVNKVANGGPEIQDRVEPVSHPQAAKKLAPTAKAVKSEDDKQFKLF
ncbi:MAG: SOS response-associated peptidase [Salaquimonas sp.]